MKIGIQIVHEDMTYREIAKIVSECEALSFDCVWIGDHFWFTSPNKRMLESWSTLSAIASSTSRIRLGSLVMNNTLREPAIMANMVSTLDHISNGRLNFGIGAGWHAKECERYHIPFSRIGTRISNLRKDLKYMKELWNTDFPTVQNPLPIWIGGFGNNILRTVAKYGDASNFERFDLSPEKCTERLMYLSKKCKQYGREVREKSLCLTVAFDDQDLSRLSMKNYFSRDYLSLALKNPSLAVDFMKTRIFKLKKPHSLITGSPEDIVRSLKKYADVGITYFVVRFTSLENLKILADQVYAEVKKW